MGQAVKKDGRIVDKLIAKVEWDISMAELAQIEVMNSVKPREFQLATEKTLYHLRRARAASKSISEICLLARKREPYKKGE